MQNTFERIQSVLDRIDSDELLLLKGHLLIEEYMTLILEEKIGRDIVKALDLTFYKKTLLFTGLTNTNIRASHIEIILKLNTLRNKVGHDLSVDFKSEFLKILPLAYGGEIPKTIHKKTTYFNSIRKVLFFTIAELSGILEGIKHIKAGKKNSLVMKSATVLVKP